MVIKHIGGVKISVLASSTVDSGFIGDVKISVLPSSTVDCVFEPRSCQTKDNTVGIDCFSAKNAALRRKSKDWSDQESE